MYCRPETRAAEERLWSAIRANVGPEAPAKLETPDDLWDHWQKPDLFLSQTCGLPYRTQLHEHVHLVGTPDYRLPDCPPGYYRSVLVMRADVASDNPKDWADLCLAYNDGRSQSGWAAPQTLMRGKGLRFRCHRQTGSHFGSARAVAEHRADIAALDAQTWRLLERYENVTKPLAVVGHTPPTPGLPIITAQPDMASRLFGAIKTAIDALSPEDQDQLGLYDIVAIPSDAYHAVPTPPAP